MSSKCHLRQSGDKLKTCNKYQKTGPITKFCLESSKSHSIKSLLEIPNCRTSSDSITLPEANCIILKLSVGDKLLDFLYDPGSQFTMIPKHIYDRLAQEPALSPINKLRVGSSATKFFPGRGSLHEHCNGIRQW